MRDAIEVLAAKGFDLSVRKNRRLSIESHQSRDTRNLQYLQPVAQRKPHENVPGKSGNWSFTRRSFHRRTDSYSGRKCSTDLCTNCSVTRFS